MAIPISWTPSTADKVSRKLIDPGARRGFVDVTLPWLYTHCHALSYLVRWWVGPDDSNGEWKQHDFDSSTPLRDIKAFAAMVAGTITPWEVEITLVGRVHTDTGWDFGRCVWAFGHYRRETAEAKAARNRL